MSCRTLWPFPTCDMTQIALLQGSWQLSGQAMSGGSVLFSHITLYHFVVQMCPSLYSYFINGCPTLTSMFIIVSLAFSSAWHKVVNNSYLSEWGMVLGTSIKLSVVVEKMFRRRWQKFGLEAERRLRVLWDQWWVKSWSQEQHILALDCKTRP